MDVMYEKVCEAKAGPIWKAQFDKRWQAYRTWFLSEGIAARQTYLAGYRQIKEHMPELLGTYETLCEVAGGGDLEARFLSFYRPPLYLSGCSQAVWLRDTPMLVRNYDYDPKLSDGLFLDSNWNGKRVMATVDGMWGVVDGMNDSGLAISLTFGGRRVVGEGFGVPIILRYILEFCETVKEATAILKRVPCHMAYNVTCVDKNGKYATAYLGPDREAHITNTRVATNHQEHVEWHRHARATATVERERFLLQQLTMHDESAEKLISAFQKPPLYSPKFAQGFGTIYTAVYWPSLGQAELRWPGLTWPQSFRSRTSGRQLVRYPDW